MDSTGIGSITLYKVEIYCYHNPYNAWKKDFLFVVAYDVNDLMEILDIKYKADTNISDWRPTRIEEVEKDVIVRTD